MSKDSNNTIIIGKIAYFPDMKAFLHQGYTVHVIMDGPIYRHDGRVSKAFMRDVKDNDNIIWGTTPNGEDYVEYIYQAPEEYKDVVISTAAALAFLRKLIKDDITRKINELKEEYKVVKAAKLLGC